MNKQNEWPLLPSIGIVGQVQDPWGTYWQARHQVLVRLARYFHVVWMNPARNWRESLTLGRTGDGYKGSSNNVPGLRIYDPGLLLPEVYRPAWLRELLMRQRMRCARQLLVDRGCDRIIFSLWRPEFAASLKSAPSDLKCYHIDDEYTFSPVEKPIGEREMEVIKDADLVFVTSAASLEKKGWINPNTTLVPNGVDYLSFSTGTAEPEDIAAIPHPRIGYVGFLKEQLDWPLIFYLVDKHPQWSFIFVGPVSQRGNMEETLRDLRTRKNVYYLGGKAPHIVPAYSQHFDVCIMPYRIDDYIKYIYPLKLHEYLATGQPTVGSCIRSLQDFQHVLSLPSTNDEWSAAVTKALEPSANTPECRSARQAVAKQHDWDIQVAKIARTLVARIAPELLDKLPTPHASFQVSTSPEDTRSGAWISKPSTFPTVGSNPVSAGKHKGTSFPSIEHTVYNFSNTSPLGPVLIVSPWYRPALGGVVEIAERLHRSFAAVGIETQLLVSAEEYGDIRPDPEVRNVSYFSPASSAFHKLSIKSIVATTIRTFPTVWRLRRFLLSHKIESIILLYPASYAWPFLIIRSISKARLVVSLHGNDISRYEHYQAPHRWLIRRILRAADAIIGCADHLLQKARKVCPRCALTMEMIPNCVDSSYFVPPPPGYIRLDRRPTFVHVSNFAPKKRTIDIIEAFANKIIPFDTRLVMVGDGADLSVTKELAKKFGILDRVQFVGVQKDIRPFLWDADVFVLASDDEGAPLALSEAMACGLPWVSTAWGPAAVLPDGECGLVVPPLSPCKLASAMAELIQSPQRCEEMGRNGRYRAETDFREEKYLQRHLDILRLLRQRRDESPSGPT
jgi:glycosyltransferase involved in cell wall biosynthesis